MANNTSTGISIENEFLDARFAEIREKLLDLSRRNPLINFKHSKSGTRYIRVVDEVPKFLLKRFYEGSMEFTPLPDIEAEPSDEKSDHFQLSLKAMKSPEIDSDYIRALNNEALERQDSIQYQEELIQAERSLRDELRKEMGMPALQSAANLNLRTHAKIHGFNPSYELSNEIGADHHEDDLMQCLLTPDQLDRRMRSLYSHTVEFQRDTGINVLSTIFGFLEWTDSKNTSTKNLSPLILVPTEMTRTKSTKSYRYKISAEGDTPNINFSLEEKLSQEFGLKLPAFNPEESLAKYFSKIETLVENRPGWALRRFVTIGVCPFSTITIHRDLMPEAWNKETFYKHATVADLFAAREVSGSGMNYELDDIDKLTMSGTAPPLVLNADSSQHTAIRRVLEGESMVIEGPPGTGKSQTITNIIGAAVAKGKRVLFVAEKQPALDVVANRLRDVGLAPLMIEPQRRGSKGTFVESLKERLSSKVQFSTKNYEDQKSKLTKSISQLNEVKDLLAQDSPYLGMSIFELVWCYVKVAHQCGDKDIHSLRHSVRFRNFTTDDHNHLKDLIARYFEFVHDHKNSTNCLESFTNINPNRLALEDFQHETNSILVALNKCKALISVLPNEAKINKVALEKFIVSFQGRPVSSWLSVENIETEITQLKSKRAQLDQAQRVYAIYTENGSPSRDIALEIEAQMKQLGKSEIRLEDLMGEIEENSSLKANYHNSIGFLKSCSLGGELDQLAVEKCFEALTNVLDHYNAATLFHEHSDLGRVKSKLDLLISYKAQVLNSAESVIKSNTIEFFETYTLAEIEFVKAAYADSNFFSFLSSKFRKAKRITLQLGIEFRNEIHLQEQLQVLIESFDVLKKIDYNTEFKEFFGEYYTGLSTDTDSIKIAYKAALNTRKAMDVLKAHGCLLTEKEILANQAAGFHYSAVAGSFNNSGGRPLQEAHDEVSSLIDSLSLLYSKLTQTQIKSDTLLNLRELNIGNFLDTPKPLAEDQFNSLGVLVDLANDASEILKAHKLSLDEYSEAIEERRAQLHLQNTQAVILELNDGDSLIDFTKHAEVDVLLNDSQESLCSIDAYLYKFANVNLVEEVNDLNWVMSLESRLQNVVKKEITSLVHDAERLRVSKDIEKSSFKSLFESSQFRALNDSEQALSLCELAITSFFLTRLAIRNGLDREEFTGYSSEIKRANFRKLDEGLRSLDAKHALSVGLKRRIPQGVGHGKKADWTDLSLIKNECHKKARFLPVRELMRRSKSALLEMKPIWLMQPLAVSQMLPKTNDLFDLVIIDEASQMLPEMAIASILRGKQTVVVGDDKQMPPSSFFKTQQTPLTETEIESESILDLATARFREQVSLRWHYRSQHESLIQFSNAQFYKNMLEVIPAASSPGSDLGIEHVKVVGDYCSGLNVPEAMAMIEVVRKFMKNHPERSLGIVTLNSEQRNLVEEELLRLADTDSNVRSYFDRWSDSELDYPMVRSLERVQGDERDTIFISTVYGPDKEGRMFQRFPLINTDYGHRRLNVLFTRARRKVFLVTSMNPSDIKLDENSKLGKKALRDYIEYAATGRIETGEVTGETADSDFEIAVADVLEIAGYKVTPQVGVRGFKIDLGVEHSDYPNGFLAGIECDGATYHSSASARDRDAIRQDILESLGWKIYRVWSTDWFTDSSRETKKMLDWLCELKQLNEF